MQHHSLTLALATLLASEGLVAAGVASSGLYDFRYWPWATLDRGPNYLVSIGADWDVRIGEIEIHLVTPFELDDPSCFTGGFGSSGTCDIRQIEPGHVTVSLDGLGTNEGVSVEGRVGQSLATTPTAPSPPTTQSSSLSVVRCDPKLAIDK